MRIKDDRIPVYSKDLLKYLDRMYPERSPHLGMTEKDIWFYAGQRELVRKLLTRLELEEQDESGSILYT